jgi:hypothetical protein
MHLYKAFMSKDNAWDIVDKLGYYKTLHFIDLNKEE